MQLLRVISLSLTLVTTAAAAQEALKEHSVSGPAAQEIRAGWFGKLNPDCSSGPLPQARLINPAANGTVALRRARVRTNNVRQCPNVELPALVVFYRAKPGYSGTDSFTLEVTGESGVPSRHKFNVNVEGWQGGGKKTTRP
jgi:hypothetical protein